MTTSTLLRTGAQLCRRFSKTRAMKRACHRRYVTDQASEEFGRTPEMVALQEEYGSSHGYLMQKALAAPDEDYTPPPFPVEFPKFTEKVKFGAEMKEKHFYLEKEWAYLNHGAFGVALKEGLEAKMEWMKFRERQVLRFYDREFFPHLGNVIRKIAKFIDADRHDVVMVPNVTIGNNTVVQSVLRTLKKGDSILGFNLAYGAVVKLLRRIGGETDVRTDIVDVPFPIKSKDSIMKLLEDCIKSDTKLAVLDHVTSNHALVLPIKEMVEVCHQRGVQVLVDGAHCVGSHPISMRDIGADYYVSNAYKWLLCPKGCAFVYVDKSKQSIVRPLAVTWGEQFGMSADFSWIGSDDYTQYFCINTVLDFWEFYGPNTIREYIYKTVREAGELLVKEWGTELLADPSFFGTMVVVRVPDGLLPAKGGPELTVVDGRPVYNYSHGAFLGNILHHKYRVEVPFKVVAGQLYVRVSVHIYNDMKDIQRLAYAINDIHRNNKFS